MILFFSLLSSAESIYTGASLWARINGIKLVSKVRIDFFGNDSSDDDSWWGNSALERLAVYLVRADHNLSPTIVAELFNGSSVDVFADVGPSLSGHAHWARLASSVHRELLPKSSVKGIAREQVAATMNEIFVR